MQGWGTEWLTPWASLSSNRLVDVRQTVPTLNQLIRSKEKHHETSNGSETNGFRSRRTHGCCCSSGWLAPCASTNRRDCRCGNRCTKQRRQ
ncbi:hypothetical protein METHPM2_780020 [Pseudomonas sp. PM2]